MGKQTAAAVDGRVIALCEHPRTHGTGVDRSGDRRTLFAQLALTGPAAERLLQSLATGTDEYIVTSVDASASVRARVTLDPANIARPRVEIGPLVIDWTRSTISNGRDRVGRALETVRGAGYRARI